MLKTKVFSTNSTQLGEELAHWLKENTEIKILSQSSSTWGFANHLKEGLGHLPLCVTYTTLVLIYEEVERRDDPVETTSKPQELS